MGIGAVLLLGGIFLVIVALLAQIAEIGWFGLIIGVIGLIILAISGTIETNEQNQKREEESKKFWEDKKILNDKEIQEYTDWINSNFKVSKFIAFYKDFGWHKDRVVAVDEENRTIIFGRRVIKFEKILQAELKTTTTQNTTIQTQKNNPLGRAVAGGIIAGGTGAIVGAVSAKETSTSSTVSHTNTNGIIIYLADIAEPIFEYSFVCDSDNKEIYSTLLAIIENNKTGLYDKV